jgi:putative DNA primase/helicase
MSGMSASDAIADFTRAMSQAGFTPDKPIIADGKPHYFRPTEYGRGSKESAWYKLHLDGRPAGAFGSLKDDTKIKWKADGSTFTAEERRAYAAQARAARAAREEIRKADQSRAAAYAARLWAGAAEAPADHDYLVKKGVGVHGLRVDDCERLIVPMMDADGTIWSAQTIAPAGGKLFVKDGRIEGCHYTIGEPGPRIVICEGFATAASIREATGLPVVVAFNAGNLPHVARAIRAKYPAAAIIIASDDDRRTKENAGPRKARAAALSVGGTMAMPSFAEGSDGTDFNDMASELGLDAVREAIEGAADPEKDAADAEHPDDGAAPTADELPPGIVEQGGFRLVRAGRKGLGSGVYRLVEKDGEEAWKWTCSRLEPLALTRDGGSLNWGRLLEIVDRDGVPHVWPMPMEMLAGDGIDLRRELLRLGLDIAPGTAARNALLAYITSWRPAREVRCVDRVGWHGDAFVLPARTYGGAEEVVLQSTGQPPEYRVTGTLADWQREIAAPAVGNTRLVLAISTALAGPLIYLAGEESGGIHLVGPSSIGKTAALHAARSVWGAPKGSWRTTDNSAEALARGACDTLLTLDEIGQAPPRVVGELAYLLGNERGKSRMRRDTSMRLPATWRTLFLSTGEVGLATRLADGGEKARAGQQVRVVEMPANAGAGFGLFDMLNGFADGAALSEHLRLAADQYCGTAGPAFVERLAADREKLTEFSRDARAGFIEEHCPADADGQVRRVCGRMAVIAAAGELATYLGITGWSVGDAEAAVAACFKAWLGNRGSSGPAEITAALRQVRLFLEQHGEGRFAKPWAPFEERRDVINRAGFRKHADGAGWTYYILPEVWRTEVCKGFDAKAVGREMADRGWLETEAKQLSRKERIPGEGLTRVYVVPSAFLDGGEAV